MELALLFIRIFLFGVFAFAGITKLFDLKGSERAMRDFGMPDQTAKPLSVALPLAELTAAVCFLFSPLSWYGAVGGLFLLLVFIGGMAWQMAKGRAPDCHCFGQIHSEPVSAKSLIRNTIFAILTLFLVFRGVNGQGIYLSQGVNDGLETAVLFLLLILGAVIALYLKKSLLQQELILKSLDLAEMMAGERTPLDRNEAGQPSDGLPMGSPFPAFELPGADGSVVSLASSLAGGRPALFIFVSPTCGPCRALLPEIAQWQVELKEKINFVLLTVGKLEENKEKLLGAPEIPIAIQKDREIAEQVRAKWTPTAILVRPDGKIASRLAAGDGAIHELIAAIRTENVAADNLYLLNGSNGITPPMIGAQIPSFKLAEIGGSEITESALMGSPTLAVFWSPTCPHCSEFAVELKEWELSGQSGGTNLIVFTNVDHGLDDLDGLSSPVVFDRDYSVSTKLGMFGTPSAVLVDESGTITTETAVGSPNIWALLGRYSGS